MPDTQLLKPDHQGDLDLSRALHGEKVLASDGEFIKKLRSKDNDLHAAQVSQYSSFWEDGKQAQNNNDESRLGLYTKLTNTYYNLATDFYEYGWGESFHFARKTYNDTWATSIARHEHFLAKLAGLDKGTKVLDVGCGVGGPAREMIRFTRCHVTGINNNDYQIERARQYAKKFGQEDHCEFVKGDFLQMPFPDNSFDAVYAIEATCHAPELEKVYSEIFRVLKPGGTFALYEWVTTDQYDENDPVQRQIVRDVEKGDGIPKLFSYKVCLDALRNCNFDIFYTEDLAIPHVGHEVPWYSELEGGSMFQSLRGFARSKFGHLVTNTMVGLMETVGLAPKGSLEVQNVLLTASRGLIAGGKMGIFTPMYCVGCKKPLN
ncbi:Delta(24)-sterol C-methyltransferase [Dimargaris xerosporica]|nr:Delta(24)-sterol C-methyltransferase [Dimargaris xerosporica]